MKLFELTGYRTHPTYKNIKTHFQRDMTKYGDREMRLLLFKDKLEQEGFKSLGMGQGGLVFEKDGYPWVFKIFTHDQAYLDFLKFAKQNQSNSLMPRIKGNLINFGNRTYCVRLEKLIPLARDKKFPITSVTTKLAEPSDVQWLQDTDPNEFERFKAEYPELLQTILVLFKKFPNHILDLHGRNIMQRQDGSIVLSDPLAESAI